jgi:hypothetical protein
MKKLILNWLFGTDNVERYMDLLDKNINHTKECEHYIQEHIDTLNSQKKDIDLARKLIKICENHGINIDEEIKQIKL